MILASRKWKDTDMPDPAAKKQGVDIDEMHRAELYRRARNRPAVVPTRRGLIAKLYGVAFGPRCRPFGAQPASRSSCQHGITNAGRQA